MHLGKGAAMGELRIGHGLFDCAVGRRWNAMAVEQLLYLACRAFLGPMLELVDQLAPIGAPVTVLRKTGIGDPLPMTGGDRQILKGSLAGDRQIDVAVFRGDWA